MASFVVAPTPKLPVGTSVSAYPTYAIEHDQPTGVATATATTAADGTTTFTGRADGTSYTAFATVSGSLVSIDFVTPVVVAASLPTAHHLSHEPGGSDALTLLDNSSLKAAAGIVRSKLDFGSGLVNADIAAAAAIAYAKLNLAGAVQAADIAAGAVTAAKIATLPRARVYNNAALPIANNTAVVLTFNTERWDTDAIHDTGTNPGRLTCKTAGLYQIVANMEWASPVASREASIRLNGVTLIARTGASANASLVTQYQLAVNDYLEIVAYQSSGSSVDINAVGNLSPEFMMAWLGP